MVNLKTKKNIILLSIIIILIVVMIIIISQDMINTKGKGLLKGVYLFDIEQSKFIEHIDNTGGIIGTVYPSFFNITTDGNLQISEEIDKSIVKKIQDKGIKVLPFLSNHWDKELGEQALNNNKELISQLVDAINEYNFDGLNIDIENVDESYASKYVEFVKTLKENLDENKELSIAVAANPQKLETGWVASFDYKALSEYCNYLVLMAYDEHYPGGPEGPVASKEFVEKSIEYSLEKMDSSKIVLGIPFYGRFWVEGEQNSGEGIKMEEIEYLIEKYNGKVQYNEEIKAYNATLTIDKDEEKQINYKKLKQGNYSIWYDDEMSYEFKLGLIKEYKLKGFVAWRLGQENKEFWNYCSQYLK